MAANLFHSNMSTETTALASSNTSTPTRRSSWKDRTRGGQTHDEASQPLIDEKHGSCTSSNPFTHAFPSTPTAPAHNPDIEAQPTSSSSSKATTRRNRIGACAMIFCVLLIWGVFIFGAAVLLDTMYPGAMKQKMEGMKVELGDTERAVRVLKNTVEGLVRYVGELRGGMVGMVGMGMGIGNNGTGEGMVGAGHVGGMGQEGVEMAMSGGM